MSGPRIVRAPRGTEQTCKNWLSEAAYRMIQNNLDPDVAFDPDNLIVYGGRGKAARNWECFDAILESLKNLEEDETLLVQSGKPVGVFKTHADAPRVLLANSNIVPHWATQEQFDKYEREGLVAALEKQAAALRPRSPTTSAPARASPTPSTTPRWSTGVPACSPSAATATSR